MTEHRFTQVWQQLMTQHCLAQQQCMLPLHTEGFVWLHLCCWVEFLTQQIHARHILSAITGPGKVQGCRGYFHCCTCDQAQRISTSKQQNHSGRRQHSSPPTSPTQHCPVQTGVAATAARGGMGASLTTSTSHIPQASARRPPSSFSQQASHN